MGIHIESATNAYEQDALSQNEPLRDLQYSLEPRPLVLQFLQKHPLILAVAVGIASTLLIVAPAVIIKLLHLSWLLLLIPGICAGGLITITIFLVLWGRERSDSKLGVDLENRILQFANATGGRFSVLQAAQALRLPIARTEEALNLLTRSGHATVEVDESTGVLTYVFPELDIASGAKQDRKL